MAEILIAPQATWKQGWQLLSSQRMIEPIALAWFLPFAFLPALTFDSTRLGWRPDQAFLMALVGYAVPAGFLLAFYYVWWIRLRWKFTAITTILAMAFAGFLRGVVLYVVGINLGLITTGDFWYRIIGAPIYVSICVGLVGALNVQRREYLDQLSELRVERHNLRLLQTGIQGQIETQRAQLSGRVQGLLGPAIWELNQFLAGLKPQDAVADAVKRLRETVDNVVRPLSQDIASLVQSPVDYSKTVQISGNPKVDYPRRLNVSSMIGAGMVVSLTLLIGFVPVLSNFGIVAGLLLLGSISLIMSLGFSIIKFVTRRLVLPFWLALLVVLASGYLVGDLPILANQFVSLPALSTWRDLYLPAGITVLTFVSFLNQLIKLQRARAVAEASSVNERLAVLNARLRQEMWLNQRRTAQLLHGPIQAALYASAMRLNASQNIDEKLLEQVRRDITAAVDQLTVASDFVSKSFDDYLSQIAAIWEDVCEITHRVSKMAMDVLTANPVAAECALETVREAVNNAIKHGDAKHIEIDIACSTPGLVDILVSNDGTGIDDSGSTGLGSTLLDEIAFDWRIETVGDLTAFRASVAVPEQY